MLPPRRVAPPALDSVLCVIFSNNDGVNTTTDRQVDTVLFDLGGVLIKSGRHSDITKRYEPADRETARQIMLGNFHEDTVDHPWHRLERGEITLDESQRLIAENLEAAGLPAFALFGRATEAIKASGGPAGDVGSTATALAGRLFEIPMDTEMIALVRKLRESDIRTGIVTNNMREFRPMWKAALPVDELFDDVVDSSEVGLRKPNPAIYQLALTRLNAVAGRTAFADDLIANVDAANALGIFGVWVDDDSTSARATIATLAGLRV